MSQPFKNGNTPLEGSPLTCGLSAAAEASIRQLIANGKHKVALEKAKEIHKAQHSAASETLLVDAYAARITSLMRQNLAVEAKSLLELARERYPSHRERLDQLTAPAVARAGDLAELVQPLSDPATTSERRIAIEQAIQQEVWDLGALAQCASLPADDPLRQAASALHRAFLAVTSGPVDEEALALPEVSRRSPLAPWKMLLRARIEGLTPLPEANELLCRMRLDLDGILEVTALEKRTGKAKQITIANALHAKSAEEIAAGRRRVQELYSTRGEVDSGEWEETAGSVATAVEEAPAEADREVRELMERSRRLLDKMHAEDREEAIDLHEKIEAALGSGESEPLRQAAHALRELLFFVEGQG